jgi:TonB-dependent SusC/RagA subfamily outer membrane receptor
MINRAKWRSARRRANDASTAWWGIVMALVIVVTGPARAQDPASPPVQPNPSETQTQSGPPLDRVISLVLRDVRLEEALAEIAKRGGVELQYTSRVVPVDRHVTIAGEKMTVRDALGAVLNGTEVIPTVTGAGKIALVRRVERRSESGEGQPVGGSILGRVVDSATLDGVVGATVLVVGTRLSVVTSANGVFRFSDVPAGERTLRIRLLGYEPQTVSVNVEEGKAVAVAITLPEMARILSEVVTTAAGQRRRLEVPNAVATINADSLMRVAPVRTLTDLLAAARVPGVEVTPSSGLPGSPSRIRIRGIGSISRSNDPVVIVDGIWINSATSTTEVRNRLTAVSGIALTDHANNTFVASPLDIIDPNSIEKIEILRGPSAVSLYGADAANGVIVVTTKRGQPGKTHWSVSTSHDWDGVPNRFQPIYKGWGKSALGAEGECSLTGFFRGTCIQDSVSNFNPLSSPLSTNQAQGFVNQLSTTVSGGVSALTYSLTASLTDQLAATKLPTLSEIRLRRLGEEIPKWLLRPDARKSTMVGASLSMEPTSSLRLGLTVSASQAAQRSANQPLGTGVVGNIQVGEDTLHFADRAFEYSRTQMTSDVTSGSMGFSADWRALPWLLPHVDVGIQRMIRNDGTVQSTRRCLSAGCDLPVAIVGFSDGEASVYTFGGRTTISLPLGPLSLRTTLGAHLRRNFSNFVNIIGDSLILGSEDINAARRQSLRRTTDNSATAGWYLQGQVGITPRLYATTGFNRDIGSALSTHIRAPLYPSFGLSWIASEEPFFPDVPGIDALRFRLAYGHSAVQPDLSAILGLFSNSTGVVGGQVVNAIDLRGLGNLRLRPERSVELEYGMEAELFQNRTSLEITVSRKVNRDQLVFRNLAPSVGMGGSSAFTQNVARVYNRTVEIATSTQLSNRPGMSWSVSMSATTNLNRVDRLGDILPFGNDVNRIVEGFPLGGVWMRPVLGYNDVNGDGLLQDDEVIVGDSLAYVGSSSPKYKLTYGTQVSLLKRRLNLNASLGYDGELTQWQQTYDGWGAADPLAPLAEQAKARIAVLNSSAGGKIGNRQTISTLRLSSVSASYTLPNQWARILHATQANVSLQGSNLGLWTRYRGRDPGINSTPVGEGLADNGTTLPLIRRYSLNVRLGY